MANKLIQLSDGTNNLYPVISQETETTRLTTDYGNFEVIKIGNMVYIHPNSELTDIPTSWTTIGTLSSKFRPKINIPYTSWVSQNDATKLILVGVFANGQFKIRSMGSSAITGWFNEFVLYPVPN